MNEQNTKLKLVKKRCITAGKIVNIFTAVTLICALVAFIAALIVFAKTDTINPYFAQSINDGSLTPDDAIDHNSILHIFTDMDKAAESGDYALPFGITLIAAAISCALVAVILTFISKILTQIRKDNDPFYPECIKNLKICFVFIAFTVLFVSSSPVIFVITCLILWCISLIFEYKAAL